MAQLGSLRQIIDGHIKKMCMCIQLSLTKPIQVLNGSVEDVYKEFCKVVWEWVFA